MRQAVTHTFSSDGGRDQVEVIPALVPTGKSQLVEYTDLVMLHHRGGGDVAVIRDGHMGDILLLTPTLRHIKHRFPSLRIHVYCDIPYLPLLDGNVHVDSAHPTPKNVSDVDADIVADLRRFVEQSPEAWITDRASLFARAFGVGLSYGVPDVYAPEPTDELRDKFLKSAALYGVDPDKDHRTVLVAPDASDPRRAMSDDLLDATLTALDALNIKYIVVGTVRGERVSNTMGVADALYYLSELGGLLSVDNGMYHAAAGLGLPAVVLFTTVPPPLRMKWYRGNIKALVSLADCALCEENQVDGCNRRCTREFDAAEIAQTVEETCIH